MIRVSAIALLILSIIPFVSYAKEQFVASHLEMSYGMIGSLAIGNRDEDGSGYASLFIHHLAPLFFKDQSSLEAVPPYKEAGGEGEGLSSQDGESSLLAFFKSFESWGLGEQKSLLLTSAKLRFKEPGWFEWLTSVRNKSGSTAFVGWVPFIGYHREVRGDERGGIEFFSPDNLFFFWYFNQRF